MFMMLQVPFEDGAVGGTRILRSVKVEVTRDATLNGKRIVVTCDRNVVVLDGVYKLSSWTRLASK